MEIQFKFMYGSCVGESDLPKKKLLERGHIQLKISSLF
jgi:hypothetical protein